jgi:hypothetical protein
MPLGPFPLPDFDTPASRAREPSRPWARMRTRWRRKQLDEALSAGADRVPARSSAYARRSRVATEARRSRAQPR